MKFDGRNGVDTGIVGGLEGLSTAGTDCGGTSTVAGCTLELNMLSISSMSD
jgi:hypothetical protein